MDKEDKNKLINVSQSPANHSDVEVVAISEEESANSAKRAGSTFLHLKFVKIVVRFWQNLKQALGRVKKFMMSSTAEEAEYRRVVEEKLESQIRPTVIFGGIVLLVGFSFFVLWGGIAPLDSAVVADGSIVLTGNHKTIQHLEGGIIEAIYVKEGQQISEGEPLIRLNNVGTKFSLHIILSNLRFAKALEKRLIAEEQNADQIDFTDPILDMSESEVQVMVKNQKDLFDLNKKILKVSLEINDQKIAQLHEKIAELLSREKSMSARLAFAKEQFHIISSLNKKGLEPKTRTLDSQEKCQQLESEVHSIKSAIAETKQAVAEVELSKIKLEDEFKQTVAQNYKENRSNVLELEQRLQALQDSLDRLVILAPTSGVITSLKYHTIGGVIQPGSPVLDIVPQYDKLIAEVRVAPQFIESLRVGLNAKIQLNAYKSRLVPRVAGEVIYVSADSFAIEGTQPFYLVRIELKESAIKNINTEIKLYPGMPVTAYIVRGTRTFLQYMLSPIIDSFHKAFKEA